MTEHDPRVTVWADGFGRWRARVSKHAAAPLLAARRAIRDELVERSAPTEVHRHWWTCLVRDESYDEGDTIVFAEPTGEGQDAENCTSCRDSLNVRSHPGYGSLVDPDTGRLTHMGEDDLMARLVDPTDLLSASDVADLLGVGAAAVSNYKVRHPDFPDPVVSVARGKTPLYLRSEILTWYRNRHPLLAEALRKEK